MMNEKALQTVPQGNANIVNIEDQAMSINSLLGQVKLIQDVMSQVMKENEHYGTIPGTKKPTLLKPGAEKLCLTFRLDPDYEIIREVREESFIAYTVKCDLTHIPTGQNIASGIGSCNSRETKYRYRFIDKSTGVPVPQKYWDAKKAKDNKEMKRLLQIPNQTGEMRAAKIDGQWMISRSQKIENENPWDLDNTLVKMACKRALIAATLNATAASDIFTQDLEDIPKEVVQNGNGKEPEKKNEPEKKSNKTAEAWDQKQVDSIRKKISEKEDLSSEDKTACFEFMKEKTDRIFINGRWVVTKKGGTFIIKNFDKLFNEFIFNEFIETLNSGDNKVDPDEIPF